MRNPARKQQRAQLAIRRRESDAQVEPPKRGRFARAMHWLDRVVETHPFAKLMATVFGAVSAIVLVGTGFQVFWDFEGRAEDREARAWTTVTTSAPGNIGRGRALNHLLELGGDLTGLDLSCERLGGKFIEDGCQGMPIFSDVSLRERDVRDWNIAGAWIVGGDWNRVRLWDAMAASARFTRIDLSESVLTGMYPGVIFEEADLTDAWLYGAEKTRMGPSRWWLPAGVSYKNITFLHSDLSGMRLGEWFTYPVPRDKLVVINGRAWADNPPMIEGSTWTGHEAGLGFFAIPGVEYCDPRKKLPDAGPLVGPDDRRDCEKMTEAEARAAFPDAWRSMMPLDAKPLF